MGQRSMICPRCSGTMAWRLEVFECPDCDYTSGELSSGSVQPKKAAHSSSYDPRFNKKRAISQILSNNRKSETQRGTRQSR